MVSSLAYDDTIDESVKIGAKGFIFKPLERTQLIHALEHGDLDWRNIGNPNV